MALMNITAENFNEEVQKHEIAILDFWAPWCAPCRSFAPIFEKAAQEHPEILFGKINTEEEQALAGHFQIRSIPTIMILKDGIIVFSQAGMLPEEGIKDLLGQVKDLDMDKVREEIAAEEAAQSGQEG